MEKRIGIAFAFAVVIMALAGGGLYIAMKYAETPKGDPAVEARKSAELGVEALKAKSYKEAILHFSEAIKFAPSDDVMLNNRGLAHAGYGDHDKAIADFDAAIGIAPDKAAYFTNRGESYLALKQYANALADFTQALKHDEDRVAAFRGRGAAYLAQKEYEKAIVEYVEAIRRDDGQPALFTALGRAYYHADKLEDAQANLNAALRADPNSAEANMLRGLVYLKLKEYAKAVPDFDAKIRLDADAEAYFQRGEAHRHQGDTAEANADYTEAITRDQRHVPALRARGNLLYQMKEYPKAIADFDAAENFVKTDEGLYYQRGLACLDGGEFERAIGDFTTVIELNAKAGAPGLTPAVVGCWLNATAVIDLNPQSAAAYHQRAQAHLRKGRSDKALQDATRAVQFEPKNVAFLNQRAAIYIRRAQYDDALQDLDAALTVDPKNIRAINTRGHLHYAQKNYEKAVADYSVALEIDAKDVPSLNNRGLAHQGNKDYEKAAADFKQAVTVDPTFAEAHNNLAWVLATAPDKKVRNPREAEKHAKKALELDGAKPDTMEGGKTARYYGTYAVTLGAQLQFDEAIRWEDKACRMRNGYDGVERARAEVRIKLYRDRLPYYEDVEPIDP